MTSILYLSLIIIAVLIGTASIMYFYFSADIFADILKKPLKLISGGMLAINLGIFLIAYITLETNSGRGLSIVGIPVSTAFYILYFVGAFMIIFGSRKFSRRDQ